jgi:bifunctional non-homologous end joining protein LigD
MGDLRPYRAKRDAARTPEPFGEEKAPRALAPGAPRRFVVQQHAARRLHWDLRLEIGGVLASWAVPRGPSLDPSQRRLAVRTEDHPLEYADFEGVIPAGEYGAGAMIVWDAGSFRSADGSDPAAGLAAGKLDLVLAGHKLRGRFALVRTRGEDGRQWLLLHKSRAALAGPDVAEAEPASVLSGLTVQELREGVSRRAALAPLLRGAPRAAGAPDALRPMLAERGEAAFSRAGWLFELKYDGVRALGCRAGGEVRIRVRTGADRTALYPELALALSKLPLDDFAIDGEIVAPDEAGRASFERIQRRFTQTDPAAAARLAVEVPVVFQAFDLPRADERDLTGLPLERRKRALARLVPRLGVVRFADHVEGDGLALYRAAQEHGLEGVVAKRADSRYEPGRRSKSWLKLRVPRTADLAVVGFTAGRGARRALGALLVAWRDDDGWRYGGAVGSGLDDALVRALPAELGAARVARPACAGVPDPPPAGATWVRPERVCEVRFTEVTEAGMLRQPVFLRLRGDKPLAECDPVPAPRAAPAAVAGASGPPEPKEELALTRLEKVFWPVEGYTKGDLLAYYEAAWPWISPYLRDRPLVLTRYPDGIEGKHFYQQNAPAFAPKWLRRERIDDTEFVIANDLRSLLWVVNSGAIPLHVWSARVGALDRPDWLILDLDPKQAPFSRVVELGRHLHRMLAALGAPHFLKTSGQAGLHVLLPLGARLDHAEARSLAEALARTACAERPDLATLARPLAARADKVYLDYLQNGRGKLIAAPFSVRPRPGAPVSMPLPWSALSARLDPQRYTIKTALRRIEKQGDPLCGVLGEPADVRALLAALERRLARAGARKARR